MQILSNYIELHVFRIRKQIPEFLLLKRAPHKIYPDVWQMISGSTEAGETAVQAAKREMFEETGLIPKKFWVAPKINAFYTAVNDAINMVPVFAALVDSNSTIQISDEHTEYQWVSLKKAKKLLAWPGQREAVAIIHQYFTTEESFLKFVEIGVTA